MQAILNQLTCSAGDKGEPFSATDISRPRLRLDAAQAQVHMANGTPNDDPAWIHQCLRNQDRVPPAPAGVLPPPKYHCSICNFFSICPILKEQILTIQTSLLFDTLCLDLCASYVRRETRFYHVDHPTEPLSRRDIEQVFIATLGSRYPIEQITQPLLKQVFDIGIERKHSDRSRSVPVWGGSMACLPGNPNRVICKSNGTVSLNTWKSPSYRGLGITEATYGPFEAFFN